MGDSRLVIPYRCYILDVYSDLGGTHMKIGSVFENNRTQAVRLPVENRFDKNIKKVVVRVVGRSRIITPVDHAWDTFFLAKSEGVSDDFMHERAVQDQDERESF